MNVLKNRYIHSNDAVMFDIDNTLIFTNGTPNRLAIELLKDCVKLGYKIIIMTARPNIPGIMAFTKYQLRTYGIYYDELYITPAHNKGNLKRYTGYNYVLSVGDMHTDLTNSEYSIKIST
jgi:hypothetical protein